MGPGRSFTSALTGLFCLLVMAGAAPQAARAQQDGTATGERIAGSIDRFSGAWVGKTTDETAVERNATLTIDGGNDGGFTVSWTSFEAPTRTDGGIIRRERKLEFLPTETPGLFRADGANDPVTDLAAWARIDADVLSVSIIAVLPDGRLERQIYDRTLMGSGLFLSYRRYLDADLVRMLDVEFARL